jgi:hypothetical protein
MEVSAEILFQKFCGNLSIFGRIREPHAREKMLAKLFSTEVAPTDV